MFNIQTHMDYEGQGRAEKLSRFIIALFGLVGLIFGAVIQQFSQTIYILGAGFLLATIVTIPPWPIFRRKSLNWQKSRTNPTTNEESKKTKQK
ncbi:unnamed protein product [Diamesa serratosioi]